MKIEANIQIHLHGEPSGRVAQLLDELLTRVKAVQAEEFDMAADVTSIKKLVTDLNDETNAVVSKLDAETAEIKRLSDIIAAGGTVTAADLQAIQDGLQPISDRLKSLGADTSNPIPPNPM